MSVLETATAAAGAATTKTREKKKRSVLSVNGKHYSQRRKFCCLPCYGREL
jgi:serine/threonine-protein kinase TTK/MPS1